MTSDPETARAASTLLVGSFHDIEFPRGIKQYDRPSDDKTFPEAVTLGFRGTFWRVFSDITHVFDGEIAFAWLSDDWVLTSAWVLRSFKPTLELYLEDQQHIFVALEIRNANGRDSQWINKTAFALGQSEQELLLSLLSQLAPIHQLSFLSSAKHYRDLPARFLVPIEPGEKLTSSGVALACFYVFAQLIIWQIDRDHASIELDPESRDVNAKLNAVLKNRARIINIRRFFLTRNITNHHANARIAAAARDHLRIKEKFAGFAEANDLIERFYLTSNAMAQNRSTKVLNITALLIAVVGLPTSIMSMLIAFQDNTLVVKSPGTLIQQFEYVYFIGAALGASLLIILCIWIAARSAIAKWQ